MINVRGVQLAATFMHGVEHAVFVNDVAGSPLPLNLFCPWMFFDGKLFQYKLLKSTTADVSLRQLCGDSVRLCSQFIHLPCQLLCMQEILCIKIKALMARFSFMWVVRICCN